MWWNTNDIVSHSGGSLGSGVGEVHLILHRMGNGEIHKVLDIVESAYDWAHTEQIQVKYPDPDQSSSLKMIIVHRIAEQHRTHQKKITCTPYRWDAKGIEFLPIPTTQSLCK